MLGGELHVVVNSGRTQAKIDCATAHRQRAMRLQPLGPPLRPPVELAWAAAPEATDRNWLLFEHGGRRLVLYSLQPHIVLEVGKRGACTMLSPRARLEHGIDCAAKLLI